MKDIGQMNFDFFEDEVPKTTKSQSEKKEDEKSEKEKTAKKTTSKPEIQAMGIRETVAADSYGNSIKGKETSEQRKPRPRDLRRGAFAWVATQNPSALSIGVPTRVSRFKADVAAVWSRPGRKRLVHPVKTLIVEVRRGREDCWPDCARREEILAPLRVIKKKKEQLEAVIRSTEPELRETDSLFEEFETWNYAESKNKEYRQCLKKANDLERSLYEGSRFERIAQANVADFLYLAVPAGSVEPGELADGWGLLHINDDLSVELIKEAEDMKCLEECKAHLAFNIASACAKSALFSEGIAIKNEAAHFTPIPKRRRVKMVK